MSEVKLILGDCLDKLKDLKDNSVDSIVTDPPYGLSFMNQKWDYDVPSVSVWKECLRVLKPGGHLLSFAGSRTYHRMAVNIEDAGFDIRDQILWIYVSGFPKSHNVSIAIDKKLRVMTHRGKAHNAYGTGKNFQDRDLTDYQAMPEHKGITDEAKQWEGWGTALKPAHEPIVLARKPFKGTVADNVLEYGTGAINIDACRIEDQNRFPANIISDGLEEWSKYFYCPKANKKDRNEGCEDLELKPAGSMDANNPLCGSGPIAGAKPVFAHNNHPTVKPTDLMRYLCRLVTLKNGTVLDPFMGSGSTGKAAILEGLNFIGIELSEDYLKIAEKRINHAITVNE